MRVDPRGVGLHTPVVIHGPVVKLAGRVGAAVRTGMIPLINSMMVVGLVSLPGMTTGRFLAGVHPLEAVKY